MKKICLRPMFLSGLAIRLALMAGIAPLAVFEWYAPFLQASLSHVTLDPWSDWLAADGAAAAFPYGYATWLVFLPLALVAKVADVPQQYGYEITLLLVDFTLLRVLQQLLPNRERLVLLVYWLSPIVILATYGLGLNDLLPALLLTLSILFIRQTDLRLAGALCAAAISAKLSMIVALPFFAIYLYNNRTLRKRLPVFLQGFAVCILVLGIPFALSGGGKRMLFGNPELTKIYSLAFDFGNQFSVYVVPLIYLVMLYITWRVKRLNFDLFHVTTGMAFLLIVLTTPSSPGWFVWSIPFLVLYQAMSGRIATVLTPAFSILYVLSTLLTTDLRLSNGHLLVLRTVLQHSPTFDNMLASLLRTAMVAIGVILALRIWREAVSRNDFFRLSRKPFVIGVAGDSGAGKDTFADSIAGLFGEHSVAKLSGDDYHLWDRQKPMWQVMTHLNPMANDLEGYSKDLVALTDGRSIQSRHYNHQTGQMSKPFRMASNDFIIASGLHALYLPILRERYNLKVYLDIDEGLRRHFKIKRDVAQRGHTMERILGSFEKREPDSVRFIRPQASHADLIFSLQPIHPRMLEGIDDKHPLRLKLAVRTRHGFNELSLNRVLVGVCGLHVDMIISQDGAAVQLTIEGDASAADIAMAAEILCPRVLEFLDMPPQWQDGIAGMMQLITLSHISQALTRRFT